MALYQEIWYRHQFASDPSQSFENRVNSWSNYLSLFNFFQKETMENIPLHWIWDIINEFVYQWQAFSQFRCTKGVNISSIKSHLDIWDTGKVILTLMGLIEAGQQE